MSSFGSPNRSGYLYCIESGTGVIKVGFSIWPYMRLKQLMRSDAPEFVRQCPGLELVGQISAKAPEELKFHKLHKKEAIAGSREWYPANGEAHRSILALINGSEPDLMNRKVSA